MVGERYMQNRRWVVKVNRQAIICFFLLLLLTLLVGANTNNPDLHNYIYNYSRKTTVVEGSFVFLFVNNLFYRNGITFQVFRLCLYAIGYIILGIAAKRLVGDKPILYIFYAIAFMMIDGTQTYNFMGMCLFLLGVSYLIVDDSRWKYVLCVVLASGFHIVFLFYLPFIFIYRRTDRKQLLKLYLIVLGVVIFISTVAGVSVLATVIQRILSATGLDTYQSFIQSRTRYGHLYPMMTHLVCCVFGYYYYSKAQSEQLSNEKLYRVILLLLLYGIFAFPFFRFQLTLGRITRNLELLTFIAGINYISEVYSNNKKVNNYIVLFGLALFLGYFIVYSSYMDTIVRPFFEFNWIFRGN